MKTVYKDWYGTYSITTHRDGTATLRCRNKWGQLNLKKDYKSEQGAKIALGRYCCGMPKKA